MELLVACGMLTTMVAIAVPQYSALSVQMRTNAAATYLLGDLNFARAMALRTGVPHYVVVNGGAGVNYQVRRSAAPPAIQPATDPVVRSAQLGSRLPGVVFSLNGATADPYGTGATAPTPTGQLVFDARGLPSSAASYFIASSGGDTSRVVSVTAAGRVRLWAGSGGTWR